ncbi:MAG TPA: sigma 54-interacting transcriptional regulator [Kofleriaceae bacterium]
MGEPDAPTISLFHERPVGGHVLLIQDGSSAMHPLPRDGVVLIGRAAEAELRLTDAACSRRHAELVVEAGDVTVRDLGSHNGTHVNAVRVSGMRRVAAGDVISIGEAIMVVHAQPPELRRHFIDPTVFRQRFEEELQRAIQYERELTAIAILVDSASANVLEVPLTPSLARFDLATITSDGALVVALETDGEAGRERALAIASACSAAPLPVRVGIATCPADGCRADALVAAARAAAQSASVGEVKDPSDAVIRLQIGNRRALVADSATAQLFQLLKRLADSELPVLIIGETGSGKENAAHALHVWSRRAKGPFVAFNAAALQESLAESELFGHEKGAFTGATSAKAGLLESAIGGTIFLDEVGDLSPAVQAKLLRALDAKRIMRVGSVTEIAIDVRVVAATHKDLEAAVRDNTFRQDLYFRLGGAKVTLPPLRNRPRELVLLAREFLDDARQAAKAPPLAFSAAAMEALARHPWPGNVRELKNEMEYVAATIDADVVQPWHLSERITGIAAEPTSAPKTSRRVADELRALERRRMAEALEASGGVQKKAAELIGMPLRTFRMKSKQYGLDRRS